MIPETDEKLKQKTNVETGKQPAMKMDGEDLIKHAKIPVPQGQAKQERRRNKRLMTAAYSKPPCSCEEPQCGHLAALTTVDPDLSTASSTDGND